MAGAAGLPRPAGWEAPQGREGNASVDLVRRIGRTLIVRINGITVALGIGTLVIAAYQFGTVAGMVALGLALIVAGVEVPKR